MVAEEVREVVLEIEAVDVLVAVGVSVGECGE